MGSREEQKNRENLGKTARSRAILIYHVGESGNERVASYTHIFDYSYQILQI